MSGSPLWPFFIMSPETVGLPPQPPWLTALFPSEYLEHPWDGHQKDLVFLLPKDGHRQRQACKETTVLGQGRAGGVDAAGPGPPAPGSHKVLTGASLALWAELKMTLGTGPGGTAREFEVWNTLPTLGLCFHPGRAGCGTQGNISVDSGFPFPLSGICEGPSQFCTRPLIDVITQRLPPAQACARRFGGQGSRSPALTSSLATSLLFSLVHCLSLLGLLGKSFSS